MQSERQRRGTGNMRYISEQEEMIARFLRLYESGMINMFEGNITVRTPDGILVTPSQMEKDRITPIIVMTTATRTIVKTRIRFIDQNALEAFFTDIAYQPFFIFAA